MLLRYDMHDAIRAKQQSGRALDHTIQRKRAQEDVSLDGAVDLSATIGFDVGSRWIVDLLDKGDAHVQSAVHDNDHVDD
jgi:hypothetical protein